MQRHFQRHPIGPAINFFVKAGPHFVDCGVFHGPDCGRRPSSYCEEHLHSNLESGVHWDMGGSTANRKGRLVDGNV